MFALANVASNWLTAGQEAQRLGNAHPSIVPYQTFKAADCELAVGAGNNKQVPVALQSNTPHFAVTVGSVLVPLLRPRSVCSS